MWLYGVLTLRGARTGSFHTRHCPRRATPHRPPLPYPQIIVLMLSQDTSFSHNVHKVALRGPIPWYRERVLTHISLGSLVYVVLLR